MTRKLVFYYVIESTIAESTLKNIIAMSYYISDTSFVALTLISDAV